MPGQIPGNWSGQPVSNQASYRARPRSGHHMVGNKAGIRAGQAVRQRGLDIKRLSPPYYTGRKRLEALALGRSCPAACCSRSWTQMEPTTLHCNSHKMDAAPEWTRCSPARPRSTYRHCEPREAPDENADGWTHDWKHPPPVHATS